MKRLVQGGALAVVLAGMATVAAQSPGTDVTFRGLIDAKNIGEYMRVMAARPHHLGSPYGKQTADWILARFKEWGWEATIESYDVLFPTPKERVLELLGPTPFKATLQEPPLAVDPTSSQQSEQLPSFNAYSVDGDVTGPLVYVNYGRPSDYEELARRGISVKGAIVIARYGQSWRGIKPRSLPNTARLDA
jgi:N-acetylated-alpha-linked acidic dipeptidase